MMYFTKAEFKMGRLNVYDKMDKNFLRKLDQLRGLVQEPLIINSSYRSLAYNKKIGGSPASKHMEGIAVDIKCQSSELRHKIVMEATSLGLSVGISGDFIHVDNRQDRDPIIFLYL